MFATTVSGLLDTLSDEIVNAKTPPSETLMSLMVMVARSSSKMVRVAGVVFTTILPSPLALGETSVSVTVSSPSTMVSCKTAIVTFAVVLPAGIVTVPDGGV